MEDFKSFLSNLGYRFFEHGVTGYRTPLGDHVYTASDDPPEVTMEPHNECSYSPFFPKKVHVKFLWYPEIFIKGQVTGEFTGSDTDLTIWKNMFVIKN